MIHTLLILTCTAPEASSLVELTQSFGSPENPTIVPYHYMLGRKESYTKINGAIGRPGYGPRTYVSSTTHQILVDTFDDLARQNVHLVYGEGSWGGSHSNERLLPHKTHKNGLYLDIFMPLVNQKGQSVLFPVNESNVFGYGVNFTPQGDGEGEYTQYSIDWNSLITVFSALCIHGGDNIDKVLIAKDVIPTLQSTKFKTKWENVPVECRKKLVPIRTLPPYNFAGQSLLVDHDDHIHVEFYR